MTACPLCEPNTLPVLWQDDECRVVLIQDPDYPAYCRVEWLTHVKEMTDLVPALRAKMMKIVFSVETAMREVLTPEKVNLASLGNMTPHLHWHVIPRFKTDKHFPNSHWGEALRPGEPSQLTQAVQLQLTEQVNNLIACALAAKA